MIVLDGYGLTPQQVSAIAVDGEQVAVDADSLATLGGTFDRVQEWGAQRLPIYGVNTGFGELAHVVVGPELRTPLQVNLLRNHATGVGQTFDEVITRAILAARLNCLTRGYSAASPAVVRMLVELLNRRIHPVIPQQGSLGASGDISPLCHMALPIIGEGRVMHDGVERDSAAVLAEHGLSPVTLGFKEGLALINGTSASTGAATIALARAESLLRLAVFLSSLYVQCLRGSTRAFDARGHDLKGHPGQIAVAASLRELLEGSDLTREHVDLMNEISSRTHDRDGVVDAGVYIQSAYTLRCVPQVLGPVHDTMQYCRGVLTRELNSSNDNPLIFDAAEESFHGGNFHGQYVAMACDYLGIALTEIGVLAERQVNRLVDPHLNGGLADFLALDDSGLSSGLSGTQYLATSIASENLDLATPSSVKTLPSNAGNQDIVSMSLNSARKALTLCENVGTILSVLAGCLFQAGHLLGPERLSPSTAAWHTTLASHIDPYRDEAPVYQFVGAVRQFALNDEGKQVIGKFVNLAGADRVHAG
jgi:histidine ammonia-lyase/tyrosine ammonia-lyase